MSDELTEFYKGKANPKKGMSYGYADDGNLEIRDKSGAVIKTIALPMYRPVTSAEMDEMEKAHSEAIAIANKAFEDARRALHEEFMKPDRSDTYIVDLNKEVNRKDIELQHARFPLTYMYSQGSIQTRKIDFDQINEVRKYAYDVAVVLHNPFTLEEQYTRIGAIAEKPIISVAEAKHKLATNQPVRIILFQDPDTNEYGFLSLKWTVQIEFNGTMYHSAKQAILAEIAKKFNDQEHLAKIMLAESPDTVIYSVEDVPGDKEINEGKWNDMLRPLLYDVNIAKFTQYPELTTKLLETGNAIIGAYEPDDNIIGIGISITTEEAKHTENWTGQNLLGKALVDIRNKIRADQAEKAKEVQQAQPKPFKRKPRSGIIAPVAPVAADEHVAPIAVDAPVVPIEAIAPTAPVVPAAPVISNAPIISNASVAPLAPIVPIASAAPVLPVTSVAPLAPIVPIASAAPVLPVTSIAPITSNASVAPVAPMASVRRGKPPSGIKPPPPPPQ